MAPSCYSKPNLCSGKDSGATQEAEIEQCGNLKGFTDIGGNFMRHINSILEHDKN
jgi:hypothetical protein